MSASISIGVGLNTEYRIERIESLGGGTLRVDLRKVWPNNRESTLVLSREAVAAIAAAMSTPAVPAGGSDVEVG